MALSTHVEWGRSILNARAQPRRESYNLKSAPGLVERFIKWKPAQKELGLASCWPIHFILLSAVGTLESSPSGRFPMISPWTPPPSAPSIFITSKIPVDMCLQSN